MPVKPTYDDSLIVLDSFVGAVNGVEHMYRVGDLIRPNDPAVKRWPHLFGAARYGNETHVEQATAAPGEKRNA